MPALQQVNSVPFSSVVALLLANTNWGGAGHFPDLWENVFSISVGTVQLTKTLSHWINDGLMALFFLIVGLEIKREVLEGELSSIGPAVPTPGTRAYCSTFCRPSTPPRKKFC